MSYSQSITFDLCFSLCSSHAPLQGPTQGIQTLMSFSNTGPSPLLQYEFFPWGTVHQECAAPTGYSSGLKICFSVSFLHGPCLLSGAAPAWALHGLQFPLGHLLKLCCGVLHVLAGWIFAPLSTSISCRRTTCIVTVFSIGCNGISALVPAEPLPFLLQ